ncbi:hypothetical protein N7532_001733 [Penicillium argentinense]|uniref:Uncharacterized protein n=1 Tax=Penicillium argentinense TaxID=1131581 RepID=A0A9W9G391_9EURO|nr:uncharacterized protein N7532_001733 [Penicillium argentinense]KAJ5111198.1 hypothetical protein N7532_001733 [Penicillium argentinense]
MKLAVQRLGDWPQGQSEYMKQNEKLFDNFVKELEGVDRIDTWDLKNFGSSKASGSDDILDFETVSWGLAVPGGIEEI